VPLLPTKAAPSRVRFAYIIHLSFPYLIEILSVIQAYVRPHSPIPQHLSHGGHGMPPPIQPPLHQSHHPAQQIPAHVIHNTPSADPKLLFFDRAKKSLENREVYEDFLKLLSLYSREIVDIKTLIESSRPFLGDGELMGEFKALWDESMGDPEKGPPGSVRTGPPEALAALPVDDGEGPSYRRVPASVSLVFLSSSLIYL